MSLRERILQDIERTVIRDLIRAGQSILEVQEQIETVLHHGEQWV